jgi:hypothetical protein
MGCVAALARHSRCIRWGTTGKKLIAGEPTGAVAEANVG